MCSVFLGVNIGGAGSYVYDTPANDNQSPTSVDSAPKADEKRVYAPKAASKGTFENMCIYDICRYSTFMLYALSVVDIAASAADGSSIAMLSPGDFSVLKRRKAAAEQVKSNTQCLLGLEAGFSQALSAGRKSL